MWNPIWSTSPVSQPGLRHLKSTHPQTLSIPIRVPDNGEISKTSKPEVFIKSRQDKSQSDTKQWLNMTQMISLAEHSIYQKMRKVTTVVGIKKGEIAITPTYYCLLQFPQWKWPITSCRCNRKISMIFPLVSCCSCVNKPSSS